MNATKHSYTPLAAPSIRELQRLGFDATRPRARSQVPSPIVPHVIATGVLNEASAYLNHPLPAEWATLLTFHAEEICAHNKTFRRRLNTKGDTGRDRLWSFMRHWLCAILAKANPSLHAQLPSDYNVGRELPLALPVSPSTARKTQRRYSARRQSNLHIHGLLPDVIL